MYPSSMARRVRPMQYNSVRKERTNFTNLWIEMKTEIVGPSCRASVSFRQLPKKKPELRKLPKRTAEPPTDLHARMSVCIYVYTNNINVTCTYICTEVLYTSLVMCFICACLVFLYVCSCPHVRIPKPEAPAGGCGACRQRARSEVW